MWGAYFLPPTFLEKMFAALLNFFRKNLQSKCIPPYPPHQISREIFAVSKWERDDALYKESCNSFPFFLLVVTIFSLLYRANRNHHQSLNHSSFSVLRVYPLNRTEPAILLLQIMLCDIQVSLLSNLHAAVTQDAAQRVNVHPRQQTPLGKVVPQCMR